jgi:hypothetical protein
VEVEAIDTVDDDTNEEDPENEDGDTHRCGAGRSEKHGLAVSCPQLIADSESVHE